jgi:hypothetical protein
MLNQSIDEIKHELEGILRVQGQQLNDFAQKISDNPNSFDQATFEIALRFSDQAIVHAVKTQERLKEVKYISLLSQV